MLKYHKTWLKTNMPRWIITRNLQINNRKSILFTFDDGPHPDITLSILEILDKYSVKALFFVVGNRIIKRRSTLLKVVEAGHAIGNHTFNHYNTKKIKPRVLWKEIEREQALLKNILGYSPRFFRPPLGAITISSLLIPKAFGLKNIFWSIEGGEWSNNENRSETYIANYLVNSIKSNDIVLLHDNNPKIPRILRIILPIMKEKGFEFENGIKYLGY